MTSSNSLNVHLKSDIVVDIQNHINPDANPVPLFVTNRGSVDYNNNKIILTLRNSGVSTYVLGGPNRTGIYLNFCDLMGFEEMNKIKAYTADSILHANLIFPIIALFGETETDVFVPKVPPIANNNHLGNEPVMYIWPENELVISTGETLTIEFENVNSHFRPAIRYLDVSWQMKKVNYAQKQKVVTEHEGLSQLAVELKRPSGYSPPPFPLTAHWLSGGNTIYTSNDLDPKLNFQLKNQLEFAISNVTNNDFILDTSKHSRGAPYFEMVLTSTNDASKSEFHGAVAGIEDLVLAELKDTTGQGDEDEDNVFNQLWRINKKIQGPEVKWEIRPDLDFENEELDNFHGLNESKVLLGKGRNGSLSFKFTNLITKLSEGVAMIQFRYYNMPEHDDGQLVLMLEKKSIFKGGNLIPQLNSAENTISSPLQWSTSMNDQMQLKTKVDIGSTIHDNENKLVSLPTEMNVHGNLNMINQRGDRDVNLRIAAIGNDQTATQNSHAQITLVSAQAQSSMHRGVTLKAVGDGTKGSKLQFITRDNSTPDNGSDSNVNMELDSAGNVLFSNGSLTLSKGGLSMAKGKLHSESIKVNKELDAQSLKISNDINCTNLIAKSGLTGNVFYLNHSNYNGTVKRETRKYNFINQGKHELMTLMAHDAPGYIYSVVIRFQVIHDVHYTTGEWHLYIDRNLKLHVHQIFYKGNISFINELGFNREQNVVFIEYKHNNIGEAYGILDIQVVSGRHGAPPHFDRRNNH